MKRTVFLSYSSAQAEAATRIELSLKGEGHSVFRDRSALPPGDTFDARIRAAIDESDLFIFLIGRDAVSDGRYTLSELKFAEQKWGHPAGHVLPVLVEPIPKDAIPAYLRAVTMLQPRGDIAAEVTAEVARVTAPWWRWFLRPQGLALLVFIALLLAGGAWQGVSWNLDRREQNRQVAAVLKQSHLLADSGNYAGAWEVLAQADAAHPQSADLIDARERLAMEWLENARGSLKDIADKVFPALSRGAAAQTGQRSADLSAHMGWADFLRLRGGVGGLDPVQHYRRAIEADPKNVFAHAMWGFEILRTRGPLAQANEHFAVALESERKREYVRHMQISALLWVRDPVLESEAVRVANAIRSKGESMPTGTPDRSDKWRLWNIYYDRLINGFEKSQFLSALPAADYLATFRWLYPESQLPKDKYHPYLAMLAQLQELNGDHAGALASYRQLQNELSKEGITSGKLIVNVEAAIKHLSK